MALFGLGLSSHLLKLVFSYFHWIFMKTICRGFVMIALVSEAAARKQTGWQL